MSLDVWLIMKDAEILSGSGIFVREGGSVKEISREEWDQKFPGLEPIVLEPRTSDEVYSANITHNLARMAEDAGIYKQLWRPDEIGITKARQLIEPLEVGLALLKSDPGRFKASNPPNGWGDYDGLVSFVQDYLEACREYPDADIGVWR